VRVYLTGGSGLLGSHLAERLRERGDEVVCLLRADSDDRFLRRIGCTTLVGDVRAGAGSLEAGMRGVDAVVHTAALVYAGLPWPRLRAVNVEGTRHVLDAATSAGVQRLVHVSSVAVYGGASGPVDESTPTDTPIAAGNLYARSKRAAEAEARAVAARSDADLTVVRPAALYGERDRMLAPRLARLLAWPVVPLLGDGGNTVAVVYAGNAADAVVRILTGPGNGVYDVGMDHPLTQRGLVEGMARALGRRPRLLQVPGLLVRSGARLGAALGLTVPGAGDLTMERVARLSLGDNPFGSARMRGMLGWSAPFTHEEGLARTAAWLAEDETSGRGPGRGKP
jgi:nucleoside-diphosphate-sugar epimerase